MGCPSLASNSASVVWPPSAEIWSGPPSKPVAQNAEPFDRFEPEVLRVPRGRLGPVGHADVDVVESAHAERARVSHVAHRKTALSHDVTPQTPDSGRLSPAGYGSPGEPDLAIGIGLDFLDDLFRVRWLAGGRERQK